MAVLIDAQSRALEAQFRAISARYATANSITPGSPYVAGSQRNSAAGNLRDYNETELEAGMPLWLPGQRDAFEAHGDHRSLEVEERWRFAGWKSPAFCATLGGPRSARRAKCRIARNRVATARDIGADMTRRVELGDAAQADALLAQQRNARRRNGAGAGRGRGETSRASPTWR